MKKRLLTILLAALMLTGVRRRACWRRTFCFQRSER